MIACTKPLYQLSISLIGLSLFRTFGLSVLEINNILQHSITCNPSLHVGNILSDLHRIESQYYSSMNDTQYQVSKNSSRRFMYYLVLLRSMYILWHRKIVANMLPGKCPSSHTMHRIIPAPKMLLSRVASSISTLHSVAIVQSFSPQ